MVLEAVFVPVLSSAISSRLQRRFFFRFRFRFCSRLPFHIISVFHVCFRCCNLASTFILFFILTVIFIFQFSFFVFSLIFLFIFVLMSFSWRFHSHFHIHFHFFFVSPVSFFRAPPLALSDDARMLEENPRQIKTVYLEASRLEYWRGSFMKALKVRR